jgi:hypothetical protein
MAAPVLASALGFFVATCAPAVMPSPATSPTAAPFKSFSIYVLSRGKGVPQKARQAMRKARELVEADQRRGVAVKMETKRLGIEGETRLCVEYEDAKAAARAYEKVKALVKGVDLARVVVEPCTKPGADKDEKGEA